MAIEIKALVCPQCGSTDVGMDSESQGVCKTCGAHFAVQQKIDTQNIFNEYHIHTGEASEEQKEKEEEDSSLGITRIRPEFEEKAFIRKAWIALAEEDAPFEVFEADFSPVEVKDHQVLMERIEVDADYHVSIGYDRQEPYTDYVTYREKVGDQYVERQRPVTKYKTVTDWNLMQGKHHASSIATVENSRGVYLNEDLFISSFRHLDVDSLEIVPEEEKEIKVDPSAEQDAAREHSFRIERSILASLPGDRHKDLGFQIEQVTDLHQSIYLAKEYETSITVNGSKYTKRAFPFGAMKIGGDKIKNENSLYKNSEKLKEKIPAIAWSRSKIVTYLTAGLLTVSILVSLFLHFKVLVILTFLLASGAYAYNMVNLSKQERTAKKEVEQEILDFSVNYKKKQNDLLNQKLASLGYEPYEPNDESENE